MRKKHQKDEKKGAEQNVKAWKPDKIDRLVPKVPKGLVVVITGNGKGKKPQRWA